VAEPDPTRQTRPTCLDLNPTRPDFLRKSNWPDPIRTRPDPRSNGLQSNRILSMIWKNTTCKLTRPDPTLTRPDLFQKIKLTRPVRSEPEPDPTRPIATSTETVSLFVRLPPYRWFFEEITPRKSQMFSGKREITVPESVRTVLSCSFVLHG
jgi:hypothetical protein